MECSRQCSSARCSLGDWITCQESEACWPGFTVKTKLGDHKRQSGCVTGGPPVLRDYARLSKVDWPNVNAGIEFPLSYLQFLQLSSERGNERRNGEAPLSYRELGKEGSVNGGEIGASSNAEQE